MKRRRTLIVSLLLVAALCMGVGYAAITGTLNLTGTVELEKQAFAMQITSCEEKGTSTPADAAITSFVAGSNATMTVTGLQDQNDTITATVTILNENDVDMYVNVPQITYTNDADDYISVTTTWGSEVKTVTAGNTTTFDITVTLNNVYTGDDSYEGTFNLAMVASSTNPTP